MVDCRINVKCLSRCGSLRYWWIQEYCCLLTIGVPCRDHDSQSQVCQVTTSLSIILIRDMQVFVPTKIIRGSYLNTGTAVDYQRTCQVAIESCCNYCIQYLGRCRLSLASSMPHATLVLPLCALSMCHLHLYYISYIETRFLLAYALFPIALGASRN